jgi:hypothetical protein
MPILLSNINIKCKFTLLKNSKIFIIFDHDKVFIIMIIISNFELTIKIKIRDNIFNQFIKILILKIIKWRINVIQIKLSFDTSIFHRTNKKILLNFNRFTNI